MVGSGTPPGAISCTKTFPREATRIVTWMAPSISGLRGSVVTRPVHVPASLFNAPNEICASDVVEGFASCPREESCAKARPHSDRIPIQSANGDFTRRLLEKLAIPAEQTAHPTLRSAQAAEC